MFPMLINLRSNVRERLWLLDVYGQGGYMNNLLDMEGGGPRVVVSTAAFHARVQGSVPCLGGLKETKISSPSRCES